MNMLASKRVFPSRSLLLFMLAYKLPVQFEMQFLSPSLFLVTALLSSLALGRIIFEDFHKSAVLTSPAEGSPVSAYHFADIKAKMR